MTRAALRSRVPLLLLLFAGGLLISGFTILRGLEPFDEGLTLQAARRVAAGQVPYRDFLWAYGPAHPYLMAGLFKLFGTSLLWWRIFRVLCDAGIALMVFALVRRQAPARVALVAWLTAACAMAQPTGANPFAPALLCSLAALWFASAPAERRGWVAAGALCAFAAAWRLDFGVYAAAGCIAAAAVADARGAADAARAADAQTAPDPLGAPDPRGARLRAAARASGAVVGGGGARLRAAARASGAVVAAFAALTFLVYLPFVIADGPADAWRDLVGRSLSQGRYWRLPFPVSFHEQFRFWGPGSFAHDAKDLLDFYVPLLIVIGLALAVAVVVLRRLQRDPALTGLAVLGATYLAYLLSRTDEFHSTPLIVVLAVLLPLVALRMPARSVWLPALLLVALLAYGAANRLSALFGPPRLSAVHVAVADGVKAPPREARAIESMVGRVDRLVPPGSPIYTITRRADLVRINDPLIYVLTQRDNPTRQDFGLQTGAAAQREIVAALERSRPRVIVRWTSPQSVVREPNERGRPTNVHILDRWVAQHYRRDSQFGDYQVLVRAA